MDTNPNFSINTSIDNQEQMLEAGSDRSRCQARLARKLIYWFAKANKENKCQFIIYGLKQAGKLRFENIRRVLLKIIFF
jgi:uncharacterized protein YccT (UPF0319 family)